MALKGCIPWNKGKRLSIEHCHNLSTAHIGQVAWNRGNDGRIIKNCFVCNQEFKTHHKFGKFCSHKCASSFRKGKLNGMFGKHQTEKQKRIISLINSALQKGENNSNWKGGFRTSNPRVYLKQWCHKNPLKVKTFSHKRRTLLQDLTLDIIQQVYEDNIKQYGTLTCYLCEKPIPFSKDHLEHKTPLSRGGNNTKENLAIACQHCNCVKHTKTELEFKSEVQN